MLRTEKKKKEKKRRGSEGGEAKCQKVSFQSCPVLVVSTLRRVFFVSLFSLCLRESFP